MANPYTEVSISNYNASPPPDDGTTGSDNQLTWAKHKDKLADPIKTAYEASQTNISSAFSKVPFINTSALTANHTQAAGDRGKLYVCTNSPTIDLLAAASAGTGFTFGCYNNGTGIVTLDPNGAETINNETTILISPGGGVIVTCDGSNWFAVGSPGARYVADSSWTRVGSLYLLNTGATSVWQIVSLLDSSGTFETFGPTSSGATNQNSIFDDIPLDATAVLLGMYTADGGMDTDGDMVTHHYARPTGSSISSTQALIHSNNFTHTAGASNFEIQSQHSEFIVQLDSANTFELAQQYSGTNHAPSFGIWVKGFYA